VDLVDRLTGLVPIKNGGPKHRSKAVLSSPKNI
jgi:hypothetical protein